MNIAFTWVNATTRQDGSPLADADIASSVVSQVNPDGSLTPVATVTGAATSASIAAPASPGTYNYEVSNVDTHGSVGAAATASAPVVIAPPPPSVPTAFTAVLTP